LREWSNGALLLGRLALCAAIVLPASWIGWRMNGKAGLLIAIVVVVPLLAKLLSKQLIELVHEGFTWLSHQPLQAWQGSYYAFDDVQVRIYEVDGALWFAVADILMSIGAKRVPPRFLATHRAELRRVPGTALQALPAASLPALLEPMREPAAGRFLLWAQRDVVRPWERKARR
jgi:hypothetical protein